MCGFVGCYSATSSVAESADLHRMRDRMLHRGPDAAGSWRSRDGRCALAHRRLSIIDLSSDAGQPMVNRDGRVVIVFNGEIYNHAELRRELGGLSADPWRTHHSDTEVLLRAYEQWGLGALSRLVGMFAVAIYDARDPAGPVLHLVRDRLGVKPLYFARTSAGEWVFGSEIRALVEHPQISAEMDPVALWHYLTFIVAPAPLTLFRGIFKLPAGCGISIDPQGRAESWRHWEPAVSAGEVLSERDLSVEEATRELERLLRQSIARRMVSDVPFGVLLSGGLDSSLNVALMSEQMDRPVRTFTVGYEDDAGVNEFGPARQVAERFDCDHSETRFGVRDVERFLPDLVRLQDEPIADNVCVPLHFLSRRVKESGCTVVQVGEGADENFLGYWWCQHYLDKQRQVYDPQRGRGSGWLRRLKTVGRASSREDAEIRARARLGQELFWGGAVCWWGELRDQLTPSAERFAGEIECPVPDLLPPGHASLDSHAVVAELLGDSGADWPDPEVLHKIPHLELKLRLPEHLLMRVDKMTMAHGVEARVPFLDSDVVAFAQRLPARYKLRDGTGKWLLKEVARRHLDSGVVDRPKQGFGAPVEAWLRDAEFAKKARAALECSELARSGLFDARFVGHLLADLSEGRGGYGFQVWTVLNVVLWHASWIEGRADCF